MVTLFDFAINSVFNNTDNNLILISVMLLLVFEHYYYVCNRNIHLTVG